ncbi:MAG: sensor histidine kinase [Pseudobdellovibrionaceae bacterium]
MQISLRRSLTLALLAIFACSCLTAATLWYSTRESAATIDRLTEAVESATFTQVIQRNLSNHRRQALLKNIFSPDQRQIQTMRAKDNLLQNSARLSEFATSLKEGEYDKNVQSSVTAYLENYEYLQNRGLQGERLYESVSQSYYQAQEAIQELVQFNLEEASKLQTAAALQNRFNYALVALSFAILVSVLMVLFFGLRRFLYKPILSLKKAIEKFELGQAVEASSFGGVSEIQSISSSFVKLSAKLSKQKETQLTFISSIAHDLKNPLGAIKMSTDLISEDLNLSKDGMQTVSIIKRQTDHLFRLIDDLMDTARIESGHLDLHLKACDIRTLVQDSALLHSHLSPIHKVEIVVPKEPALVMCDSQRLTQVFNNLLNNAIKYSPQGGAVKVQVQKTEQNVFIEISDPGIGIPENEIESIFEPFKRSSVSKDSIPGIGLGLSAAKKIINAHESGEILVQSTQNVGTSFLVKLKALVPNSLSLSDHLPAAEL